MERRVARRLSGALIILLVTAVLLLAGLPFARAGEDTLLTPLPGSAAQRDATLHAQRVAVNWPALGPQTERVTIPLFDGETITAVRERTDPSTEAGGYVWVGRIPGRPHSAVTLSVAGGVLIGSVSRDGLEQIEIDYDGREQIMRQLDPRHVLDVNDADSILPPQILPQAPADGPLCEDGSRIDLMLAYTAEARQVKGADGIKALLNKRVADMNSANAASGVPFKFRLVKLVEVAYKETGNVATDLQRLTVAGDGHLDDLLALRRQVKADLSALVIAESDTNLSCGIAYVMSKPETSFARYAFNVTALDYAGLFSCGTLTLAHEFGHNMGNLHDRANTAHTPIYPYSYGYQAPSRTFRTIMSYPCTGCQQINQWSNPAVKFHGEPTGVSHDHDPARSADNARSMRQAALYAANFEARCAGQPQATPTPPAATATAVPPTTTPQPPQPTATPRPGVTPQPTRAITGDAWQAALPLILR